MTQNDEFKTYAEVEAYVDSLNANLPEGAEADLSGGIEQVCKYYKIVRPILNFFLDLPLIPEKIKKPISTFMGILDNFCPTDPNL